MCGRYTLAKPIKVIESHFGPLRINLDYRPSYNIAPSQSSSVVINNSGEREMTAMKWGLVPSWAKDEKMKFINARSETAHEKPSFKNSLRNKRCLIPADGFIEWSGAEKQPCYIYLKEQTLFGFAGLWSTWNNTKGLSLNTYSILTTEANEKLNPIHARMPIILHPEHYETWLAQDSSLDVLRGLLTAYPSDEIGFHPVSKEVNSPRNNHSEILQSI